ncbi:Uncharacterised protein [Mycobacteroides abscessus subsp. massiliense]|nr:Uncharacterised protein [Mycobacteroides abscessus subsp. massiliense]
MNAIDEMDIYHYLEILTETNKPEEVKFEDVFF